MVKNKTVQNAAWMIGSKLIQSLLGLLISMITARYLGPANFGIINYASSIVTFLAPAAQLGLTGILVQELILDPDREGEILGTSVIASSAAALLSGAGVFCFTMIANAGETEVILVCSVYSILLLCQALDMIYYWFQAHLLSKYTSVISLAVYLLVAGYRIVLLATRQNVVWFALSYSLETGLAACSALIVYRRLYHGKFSFSVSRLKAMMQKSKYYIVSGLMIGVFAQTDRIMLKLMIDASATGFYSAAVTIAGLTSFVFGAMLDSARPSVFQSKKNSQKEFEHHMGGLYALIIYAALLQSVFIFLFAKWIVLLLYGSAYQPTVTALKIIVWYTTFSYVGAVRNIWLLAEGKQYLIWKIDLSGALVNVCLNAVLIPAWGINGAAAASLVTQLFANVVMGWILKDIRPNNRIMLKSLDPRVLIGLIGSLKKDSGPL